jgi:hypothetical protein
MIDSNNIMESEPKSVLTEILETENLYDMLISLKVYFDGLATEEMPEKARQVVEVLKQRDAQTREEFIDYLVNKKFITNDLYRELSSKGPRAGTQGEHTDTHIGNISKSGF